MAEHASPKRARRDLLSFVASQAGIAARTMETTTPAYRSGSTTFSISQWPPTVSAALTLRTRHTGPQSGLDVVQISDQTLARQIPPLATRPGHVTHRVEHLAQIVLPLTGIFSAQQPNTATQTTISHPSHCSDTALLPCSPVLQCIRPCAAICS